MEHVTCKEMYYILVRLLQLVLYRIPVGLLSQSEAREPEYCHSNSVLKSLVVNMGTRT